MKKLIPLLLAFLLVLPACTTQKGGENMAVTEYSGNGKAFYGKVVLPNLPEHDAVKYPHQYVVEYSSMADYLPADFTGYVLMLNSRRAVVNAGGAIVVEQEAGDMIHNLYSTVSGWATLTEIVEDAASTNLLRPANMQDAFFWGSHDVLNTDGTTYLAATGLIPLDGANVIEWDGDTSGLASATAQLVMGDFAGEHTPFYRIADFIDKPGMAAIATRVDNAEVLPSEFFAYANGDNSDWNAANVACCVKSGGTVTFPLDLLVEGASLSFTADSGGLYVSEELADAGLIFAYPASSGEDEEKVEGTVFCNSITDTSAMAWLTIKGLDSNTEYTAEFAVYRNDATGVLEEVLTFTGSDNIQYCEFTGLLPETDYVLAVNVYPTHGESVYFGECEFTTLEAAEPEGPDFSEAYMEMAEVTPSSTSVFFRVGCYKFPSEDDGGIIMYPVTGTTSDGKSVDMAIKSAASGASFVRGTLNGLEPNTEYTVTFEAFHEGVSTGVTVTTTFRTTTYDRKAFLSGLAFGLMTGGEFG